MDPFIIKNGRITEKASVQMANNVYTFDVATSANKTEIKKAVFHLYKVKPTKVHMITVPKKNVNFRNRPSSKGGGKKALVYLKQGDKIELI